jgi:RimJ/RimL family protein N-acetyltransferase
VHVLNAAEWPLFRRLRLEALRESPDAFSSTLAEWQGPADTEQRWRSRLTDVPFNAIAYVNGEAAGMVSATSPNDVGTTELISMWVAPAARGQGVGDALVEAVIRWAGRHRIGAVRLEVVEDNLRARAFYERCGFVDQGPLEKPDAAQPERGMLLSIGGAI